MVSKIEETVNVRELRLIKEKIAMLDENEPFCYEWCRVLCRGEYRSFFVRSANKTKNCTQTLAYFIVILSEF